MLNPLVILVWSTNAYHSADLGRNQPQEVFTNHYHRIEGDSQLNSAYETQWLGGQGGVGYVGLYTVRMVVHTQNV